MKETIGTSRYIFSLFPKKISSKIKDKRIPKQVKIRLKWIEYYLKTQNISKTYRYFEISRTTFYKCKGIYYQKLKESKRVFYRSKRIF